MRCGILCAIHTHAMNVTVYSTPTCPYCKLVKEFLTEKEVSFKDVDVASNPSAANEMVKLSNQMGVPVVDIDGHVVVGWNKDAIEEVLANAKSAKKPAKKAKETA